MTEQSNRENDSSGESTKCTSSPRDRSWSYSAFACAPSEDSDAVGTPLVVDDANCTAASLNIAVPSPIEELLPRPKQENKVIANHTNSKQLLYTVPISNVLDEIVNVLLQEWRYKNLGRKHDTMTSVKTRSDFEHGMVREWHLSQ